MTILDWAIIGIYLTYMIWDGIRMTKNSGSKEGYFLADRGLPWWAVGLSVMATQMSAITLIGTTGQAYSDGMRFIQFYYGLPFAMIVLCVTVVPFFHRAKVFTAYEYLERRFDVKVRTLTSFFFLISRGLGVGTIISAPAIVLSVVFGWNLIATIFAIGHSTTIYTVFGGVQAVTWTDVKQMVIILVGLGAAFAAIVWTFPPHVSLGDGLSLAGSLGKLDMVDTHFDLNEKYTIWSGLIGGFFLMLGYFGCDQSQVQRFLTARSIDQGRTSLLMSAFLKIPIQFLILLIGILVFVFYQFSPPPIVFSPSEMAKAEQHQQFRDIENTFNTAYLERRDAAIRFSETPDAETRAAYIDANRRFDDDRNAAVKFVRETSDDSFNDVNYVFPSFILHNLPTGIIGLLIAAIFAAAMSSIAAELNALATATTIDMYRRLYRPEATDSHYVMVGRISTFLWGIFACFVAIFAVNLGSLIEVVNIFGSFFYGSLLGVFVLAFAVRRSNARGAFFGLLFGITSVWIASRYTKIEFLWFNVIGCLVTVAAGYLISLTGGSNKKDAEPQS
jgi:SSS family transporter